jgi:hypothetical protein
MSQPFPDNSEVLFVERQQFRQRWLWLLLGGSALLQIGIFGWAIIQQIVLGRPWGNHPTSDAALIGITAMVLPIAFGLRVLFYYCGLTTTVRRDGVYLRFSPFHRREMPVNLRDAVRFEARTYSPLREYGGWGIRMGYKRRAYNVAGNRGVQIEYKDGSRLMIGSQRPEELEQAIRKVLA